MVDVFGTGLWNSAFFCESICVTVSFHCCDKYLSKISYKEREFILAKVSEVSVHDCPASLLLPCGGAEERGYKRVLQSKICSSEKLGSREKRGETGRAHFPQ